MSMNDKSPEVDFERAISQSHLSPTPLISGEAITHSDRRDNLRKIKSAGHSISAKIPNVFLFKSDFEQTLEDDTNQAQTSDTHSSTNNNNNNNNINNNSNPCITTSNDIKRNDHITNNNNINTNITSKIYKKSAQNFYSGAVGYNVGKYSDAQKTELVLDDLPNSITEQSNTVTNNNNNNTNIITSNNKTSLTITVSCNAINSTIGNNNNINNLINNSNSKTVKKSAQMTRKKSKKPDTSKSDSFKSSTTRKSENSIAI
jgi:hypothetical protein